MFLTELRLLIHHWNVWLPDAPLLTFSDTLPLLLSQSSRLGLSRFRTPFSSLIDMHWFRTSYPSDFLNSLSSILDSRITSYDDNVTFRLSPPDPPTNHDTFWSACHLGTAAWFSRMKYSSDGKRQGLRAIVLGMKLNHNHRKGPHIPCGSEIGQVGSERNELKR